MSKKQVIVIGSGPGGYTAAFRLADLSEDRFEVTLIEEHDTLGGVCLNVGCIPSKALLHTAAILEEASHMGSIGVKFSKPDIDLDALRSWKNSVIGKLTQGLSGLAKQRKVKVLKGRATFKGPNEVLIQHGDQSSAMYFDSAIIAVGSRVVNLPFIPEDPRIFDSTGALELPSKEGRMLVIGGGIIGMEMATVYQALGMKVSVVELSDGIIPGADRDIVQPLTKRLSSRLENLWLNTQVNAVEATKKGLAVSMSGEKAPKKPEVFDWVLVAVGRRPNGDQIQASAAGVHVDERGFIPVNRQMQTNVRHIFAIGDVVGNPMLAHKAIPEGRVAAEVIAGLKHDFVPMVIPSVAYTNPEIAWVGVTETQAKAEGIPYEVGAFPWAASGRALSMERAEGITKLLFDPSTHRIIGGGIVGVHAGDLIGEVGLAIEMGCKAEDISLTIHPHPTLTETIAMATEVFEGSITDLYLPKKRKKANA